MLTRDKSLELLHQHTQNPNLRRHMYAVGAVMKALAVKLNGDSQTWEILGLLHDADCEETKDKPEEHTKHTLNWLNGLGITEGSLNKILIAYSLKKYPIFTPHVTWNMVTISWNP